MKKVKHSLSAAVLLFAVFPLLSYTEAYTDDVRDRGTRPDPIVEVQERQQNAESRVEQQRQEARQRMEGARTQVLERTKMGYNTRMEVRQRVLLAHVERLRTLRQKFERRVNIMRDEGFVVPDEVNTRFLQVDSLLNEAEVMANNLKTVSTAESMEELRAEYSQSIVDVRNVREKIIEARQELFTVLTLLRNAQAVGN